MSDHVEEREFMLRLELKAAFPEDYEGDHDGYAWIGEFQGIAAEIVAAVARVVGGHPGWTVRGGNRGRSSQDEVTLVVERQC